MFVMHVTFFVIITIFLRNNHMKNQMVLMMIMMMKIMLSMEMEMTQISSQMSNWRQKIQNTHNQSGTYFHHICKEYNLMI